MIKALFGVTLTPQLRSGAAGAVVENQGAAVSSLRRSLDFRKLVDCRTGTNTENDGISAFIRIEQWRNTIISLQQQQTEKSSK